MKTIILCGGKGSRLSEETEVIPKPMVKIGKKPILSHIIAIYEGYDFRDFILATGYKSSLINKFYLTKKNKSKIRSVYTGKNTLTGGRLLRLKKYINRGETFMLTYGDGLTSQNIKKLVKFHFSHGKIATLTAVRPPVRFGELALQKKRVKKFQEKPQIKKSWINGGFFVFNYKIFNFIKGDQVMLEREPLEKLAKINQLMAYKHDGFWQCMDTMREKNFLNKLYREKNIPWVK